MEVEIGKGDECRVELPPRGRVKVALLEGSGEINGQELLLGKWYTVEEAIFFVFTYVGCKLKFSSEHIFLYKSSETNIPSIFNVFYHLREEGKRRIMVVGEGRTTFFNILSNYFIRKQERVVGVDLDVHSGPLMFPGCLSTCVVEELYSPVDPFSVRDQICYFFGGFNASDNTDYYQMLEEKVMEAAEKKEGVQIVIGDKEIGREEIEQKVQKYKLDSVVVIGDERLFHMLRMENKVFVRRFGGLVERKNDERRIATTKRIKRFFYGGREEFTPCTITIRLQSEEESKGRHAYRVVQVGEEHMAPMSALPLGASRRMSSTAISDVAATKGAVLGISDAEKEEEISTSPVVGFLVVAEVVSETELKVLSPQPKCLKKPFLVQGKIKLIE